MADCQACSRPVPDVAFVCPACETDLAGRLSDTADLWPELLTTAAGLARMTDPGPRTRGLAPPEPIRPDIGGADQQPGPPTGLPFRWNPSIDREDIQETIGRWRRRIAWRRGLTAPTTVPETMRWLAGQLGWLRYRPSAADAWDELSNACSRITPALDRPPPRLDAGLCMAELEDGTHCPQRLSAPPGARLIHCPGCGGHWDPADRSTVILAAAQHVLGTAAELSAWLTIHGHPTQAATVRRWAMRHQLQQGGVDRNGNPTYPFGRAMQLRTQLWGRRGTSRSAA